MTLSQHLTFLYEAKSWNLIRLNSLLPTSSNSLLFHLEENKLNPFNNFGFYKISDMGTGGVLRKNLSEMAMNS